MNQVNQTPKDIVKSNMIITVAMTVGALMMLGIIHFVVQPKDTSGESNLFMMIAVGAIVLNYVLGRFLSQRKLSEITEGMDLVEKLTIYKSALILRFATLEGPALICIIFYMLEGRIEFVIMAIALIAMMILSIPNTNRVIQQLNLNFEEQKEVL